MISTKSQRPGGYAHWFNGGIGEPDLEQDTFTCFHCGDITFVKPFQQASEAGGWCLQCQHLICTRCADLGFCEPFEKKLDAIEKLDIRKHQAMGIFNR